jgi:hypothetical protein
VAWLYPSQKTVKAALASGELPKYQRRLKGSIVGFQSLHRMGNAEAQYFPGVAHAIIFQQLGPLTWELLDEFSGERGR